MRDSISKTNINKFTKDFKSSATSNITRNALVRSNINDVAMDWDGLDCLTILILMLYLLKWKR